MRKLLSMWCSLKSIGLSTRVALHRADTADTAAAAAADNDDDDAVTYRSGNVHRRDGGNMI